MESKKDIRFQIRMTPEEKLQLHSLAQKHKQPLGQFLIDSALENTEYHPIYNNEFCSFLLHLEALQKVLDSCSLPDNTLDNFRTDLNKEAKELWQSLSMLNEHT